MSTLAGDGLHLWGEGEGGGEGLNNLWVGFAQAGLRT
jgi:hypothetical protein